FQVCSENGIPLKTSRALGAERLPFNTTYLSDLKLFDHAYQDATLTNGKNLRLVTLKSPIGMRPTIFVPKVDNRGRGRPIPRAFEEVEAPVFYWQYAIATTELNKELAHLETTLTEMHTAIESISREAVNKQSGHSNALLTSLQTSLTTIYICVFAA